MPSELEVREELRRWIAGQGNGGVQIVDEFWVPSTNERADLAAIGGTLDGFEIKTAQDTLKRLPRQSEGYARLFDHCTAVVAERHLSGALETLPAWWGVVLIETVDGNPALCPVREAGPNPLIDGETLVRLLWKKEARDALGEIGVDVEEGASRCMLWERLVEAVSLTRLAELVRHALLGRDPSSARIPTRRFSSASL